MAYWQSTVEYHRENGTKGAGISGGKETLNEALSDGFQTATYYLLECGYPLAEVTVAEYCDHCYGLGTVTVKRPRSTKTLKCKACKGHEGALRTVGPFPVTLHENARHRAEPAIA